MKRQHIIALLTGFTAIGTGTFLCAQVPSLVVFNQSKTAAIGTVDTTGAVNAAFYNSPTVYVKAKVMRMFLYLFNDATEVKWSVDKGQYFASFIKENRRCRALFNSKGALIYCIQSGTEKDLPPDARKLIKSTYTAYTIGVVQNVNEGGLKSWVVTLEDPDNLVVAQITNGTLDELHHYSTHF